MNTELMGRWRIVETDRWDQDALDLLGPAFIEIGRNGLGNFRMVAVEGDIDARLMVRDGRPAIEFSWDGYDESDRACGRGWAVLDDAANMTGHIFFHRGDDAAFRAERFGT